MLPQTQPRQRRNSTRVNLMIAFGLHAGLLLALVYFAAREGFLGKQFKKIAVEIVKEKLADKSREKETEKPKDEPPKPDTAPKLVDAPRIETPKAALEAPAPSTSAAPPPVAPPASEVASFDFGGGKTVQSSSDPVEIYRGFVEHELRANWTRPDGIVDDYFVAEVEVAVDASGRISDPEWKKGSGDSRWDDSVRQAIASTRSLERPPPPHFPSRILLRFDVQDATEPIIQ